MPRAEDEVMPFGKHKDKTLGQILQDDPAYLDWLNDTEIRSGRLKAAVRRMNEVYEAEIQRAIGD
jgi:uncharacterized protein (DUF3820 family)